VSPSILNGLVEKKIFEIYFHEVGRLNQEVKEVVELNALNEFQQRAHDEIVQSFQEKNVCLLHGGMISYPFSPSCFRHISTRSASGNLE